MKRLILLSVVALSGCVTGPVSYLHKTGSSVAQRQSAFDQCRIQSMQSVPSANRTVYSPGFSTPGTTYCNRIGNSVSCNTVGGVNIPDSINTVDDNEGLRTRTLNQCLASKGYTIVQLPVCQGKKDYEGDSQPPLSQLKCATPRVQY